MHFVYEERRTMSNHNPVTPRGQDLAHTAL
jgi:hypothetical protein